MSWESGVMRLKNQFMVDEAYGIISIKKDLLPRNIVEEPYNVYSI